jgi:lipopolysaccharide biosynthesis glycosyltransferase
MVQQAIINNLAAKGISNAPSGGDITVAYLVIVGNNISTTSLNEYFGYTDDAVAMVEEVHKKQTASQGNRGYFEAGTLVIDFLSPSTSKVLQRRSIEAPVLRNLPTEQRTERVQSIVNQALSDLPIAP